MNLVEHSWRLQVLSIVVKPSMRLCFIFWIAAVSLSLVDTAFSGDATAPGELLWKVVESECPPDVRAAIHSVPTDNGVDTLITLTNASSKVSELPNFRLGPITVDSSSKWIDFREVGRPTQLDALGTSASATYPGLLYSPVAALITGEAARLKAAVTALDHATEQLAAAIVEQAMEASLQRRGLL